MSQSRSTFHGRNLRFFGILILGALAVLGGHFYLYGQDKSGFPEGYDAVQAAPTATKLSSKTPSFAY